MGWWERGGEEREEIMGERRERQRERDTGEGKTKTQSSPLSLEKKKQKQKQKRKLSPSLSLTHSAALAAIDALPFVPGGNENPSLTIVANDWHSALVPVLVKDVEKPAGRFRNAKVALCIHNAAFQGRFHADSFGE